MAFSVSPITENDVEAVLKFMKRTFYVDEPIYKAVRYCTSENDDTFDSDEYCKHILPGVSFQAKDNDGNIIGALLCDICPVANPTIYTHALRDCRSPRYKTIIQMCIVREMLTEIWSKFPNDVNLIEVKMASTDSQWRNKGVMNRLMVEVENAARENNVRLLRMETSSAYSAKSAERRGFKCIFKRLYTDFQLDGKPFIVTEPPHVDDRVYVKELF
ncbi:unnamed protein product [Pieris macdunnoughi]|uniref:N-acetyltransferase domain-containing protein n=1 Tax=Pieris macdunnoughi TaxID=345717 RepID=A0A821XHG6_9NEOP|nr:unnamed protein product [Pieris macdunnoughi]